MFVDRGGLRRLESEAAEAAVRRIREAAYPLIFKLFGSEMPRGKQRKLVLTRLSQDLSRIEQSLGYRQRPARDGVRASTRESKNIESTRRERRVACSPMITSDSRYSSAERTSRASVT